MKIGGHDSKEKGVEIEIGRDGHKYIDPEEEHEIDEQRRRCVEHTQSRHIKRN